jgi:hypothetical protein
VPADLCAAQGATNKFHLLHHLFQSLGVCPLGDVDAVDVQLGDAPEPQIQEDKA